MKLKSAPSLLKAAPSGLAFAGTDDRTVDARRRVFNPARKLYNTSRWRRLRLRVFQRDQFTCQMQGCGRVDPDVSRLVCDHRIPHRGDEKLFWDFSNLQTLCKTCHDSTKQAHEIAEGM